MKYFTIKTMLTKKILILSLLITFGCDNGSAQRQPSGKSSTASKPLQKNKKQENKIVAPDFTLADLEGNLVSMNQFQGKVVLLNFWGTWCGPCRVDNPNLVKLYDKFNPKGLEIFGVSLDIRTVSYTHLTLPPILLV